MNGLSNVEKQRIYINRANANTFLIRKDIF